MSTNFLRIVISGGHTGGHFFPAVTFARSFKKSHPEAEIEVLLGRIPAFAQSLASEANFQVRCIKIPPFPKFFSLKMISFLLRYPIAYIETFVYLAKLKPSLVVGFGSYASVPSVLCAAVLRIPTLLHEQNRMAGQANRFLSLFVNQVAVSFPETERIPAIRKTVWSGYPLRDEFLNLTPAQLNQKGRAPFKILVFGGSQGARRLNDVLIGTIERLGAEEKKDLAVKHIAGVQDLERIQLSYQRLGVPAEVSAFSHHIAEDYESSDLIISRSGAGTVFELIAAARPAILVPYPHAYAHQKLNADYLSKRNAAVVIDEEHLSEDVLAAAILDLKHNVSKRQELINGLKGLRQSDAAQNLVRFAWELACRKN